MYLVKLNSGAIWKHHVDQLVPVDTEPILNKSAGESIMVEPSVTVIREQTPSMMRGGVTSPSDVSLSLTTPPFSLTCSTSLSLSFHFQWC